MFDENRAKYEDMARFPFTTENKAVSTKRGVIRMKYEMPAFTVKLLELVPQK